MFLDVVKRAENVWITQRHTPFEGVERLAIRVRGKLMCLTLIGADECACDFGSERRSFSSAAEFEDFLREHGARLREPVDEVVAALEDLGIAEAKSKPVLPPEMCVVVEYA